MIKNYNSKIYIALLICGKIKNKNWSIAISKKVLFLKFNI